MNEKYNYNLSGSDRKPLIETISRILDKPVVYQGAPSFSYIIGDFTVDRNGVLSCAGSVQTETAETLVENLRERGFVAEAMTSGTESEEPETAEDDTGEENTEETAITENTLDSNLPDTLTIRMPDSGFTPEARENLKKIVASKATLLRQALETDSLPIIEHDGKIAFPWFTLHGLGGEAEAYSLLVTGICKMAKNQKRVTATERPVENAKFDMRLFLIRLGFIGDEYKTARKILLRNLTGNSSWKAGRQPERQSENTETDTTTTDAGHADADVPAEEMPVDIETSESLKNKNEGGEDYGK